MNYKLFLLLLMVVLFTACGEDNTESSDNNKTHTVINNNDGDAVILCQENQKNSKLFNENTQDTFQVSSMDNIKLLVQNTPTPIKSLPFDKKGLYQLFTTEYYWASLISKDFDYSTYSSPQSLIDKLRYRQDLWSFATTVSSYNSVISQKSVGVGIICQEYETGCLITYVRLDSPADRIDLRRGDIITKIDGSVATKELFYEEAQKQKRLDLELIRAKGNYLCKGSITPKEYIYKVAEGKIVKTPKNQNIAYLRLDSFLGEATIEEQINDAFNMFKKNDSRKLIIDLRYNGGGSVDLASNFLNKLTINHLEDEQFTLAWNSNYQQNNNIYRFKKSSNALDLEQIIFLTTQNSASASELVISAMKPYLPESDVVIIGDRTHGKPVGMEGRSDGNYYFFLINFVVKNALGFYDYFEGLPVTEGCNVADDPFHEMGDPNESMLKTALYYIDNGSCK